MIDPDDLPRDPDFDTVHEELELLAGLNHGQVVVISEDGVSRDTLVVVPGLFGHAARLKEVTAEGAPVPKLGALQTNHGVGGKCNARKRA